jgi:hypothetical protein
LNRKVGRSTGERILKVEYIVERTEKGMRTREDKQVGGVDQS